MKETIIENKDDYIRNMEKDKKKLGETISELDDVNFKYERKLRDLTSIL